MVMYRLFYVGHNADQIWDDMNKIIVMVMLKFESSVYKATKEFGDTRYHVISSTVSCNLIVDPISCDSMDNNPLIIRACSLVYYPCL